MQFRQGFVHARVIVEQSKIDNDPLPYLGVILLQPNHLNGIVRLVERRLETWTARFRHRAWYTSSIARRLQIAKPSARTIAQSHNTTIVLLSGRTSKHQ